MDIRIITEPLQLNIYGFGNIATNKDYVGEIFKLSGKMWEIVKANDLKNKGKNIWVYDIADKVFAGIELDNPTDNNIGLKKMIIDIQKYAYYKHMGSYKLIKQVGQQITEELTKQGYEIILPYIEIYGHWSHDESKLENSINHVLKIKFCKFSHGYPGINPGSSRCILYFSRWNDSQWSGDHAHLILKIDCLYLAEKINPSFESFYVELLNVEKAELDIWAGSNVDATTRTDLKTIFEAELEILSSKIENGSVIISCNQYDDQFPYWGANLTLCCNDLKIYDHHKNAISLDYIGQICRDYWNSLRN